MGWEWNAARVLDLFWDMCFPGVLHFVLVGICGSVFFCSDFHMFSNQKYFLVFLCFSVVFLP